MDTAIPPLLAILTILIQTIFPPRRGIPLFSISQVEKIASLQFFLDDFPAPCYLSSKTNIFIQRKIFIKMMNFVRFHTRGINRITCGFGIIVFGLLSFLETPPIFAQAIEDLSPEILSYGVVEDAKFTPDGKMIAVQIREGILFLDATTRASVKILPYPQTMRSNGISYNKILFSPDGERLLALVGLQPASGRSFMRLFIWNWKTGQLELVLRPVEEDILDVDFSGDGEKLYMIRNLSVETTWPCASSMHALANRWPRIRPES